jgi:aspartokinase
MTKASVKIMKISRDAKVTFKVLSFFLANELTRMLKANQISINLTTQNEEIVKFRIESKDVNKNLVTIKLLFNDSKKISPGTVRN